MSELDARAVFGLSPDEGHESDDTVDSPDEQTDESDEGYLPDTDDEAETEAEAAPEPQPEPQLFAGKYRDVKELENAYTEAQRAITQKGQEAAEYRKQVEQYSHAMQMIAYQQAVQQQQALAQQQAMMQQQTAPQAPPEPQYDPEELMTELYKDPVATMRKVMAPQVEQAIKQGVEQRVSEFYNQKLPELGQLINATVGPLYQQAQFQSAFQEKLAEVNGMRQKYADFEELKPEVSALIDEMPQFVQLQGGLELAYHVVKGRRVQGQAQAAQATQQNQQLTVQKMAAGMAGSNRVQPKQKSPNDAIADEIFGFNRGKRG